MDRRRLLAATGATLGIAGAVGAVVITPAVAVVSAIGAFVAAVAALLGPNSSGSSAGDPSGAAAAARIVVSPPTSTTDAESRPRSVESSQLATAGAPSGPPPNPGSLADTGSVVSPTSGQGPASVLTDPVTGLFSQDYFDVAIEARIAAARRHLRPVGVVMLEVVEGLRVGRVQPTDPKRVAEAINETLREADTACRRSDGRFALLLEDTPENGAIWTVERIRRFLAERDPTLTLWAGVACYPAHGFSSDALVELAGTALTTAREWRQDRIEVAISE